MKGFVRANGFGRGQNAESIRTTARVILCVLNALDRKRTTVLNVSKMQSTAPRDYASANSTGQEKRARNISSQGLVTLYVREGALVQA